MHRSSSRQHEDMLHPMPDQEINDVIGELHVGIQVNPKEPSWIVVESGKKL